MMSLAWYVNAISRFNAMTLRERALVAVGVLALLVLAWDQFLMNPLRHRQKALTGEIDTTRATLASLTDAIEGRARDNPMSAAMQKKQSLTLSLAAVDAQLQSESAGLISPDRMLEVLRDVLNRQHGLRLVSMRNLPVVSLVPPAESSEPGKRETKPQATTGPYVHSMEIVLEGGYLDVLAYLKSVEALPWRFYWQLLDLKTDTYPVNRVRIRLNTLSMDKEWLGV